MPGIDLEYSWEVTPPESFPGFLRALPQLVPSGAVLYIESGVAPPHDMRTFLEAHPSEEDFKIRGGTLLPTPKYYHMQITSENIAGLAVLAERLETPVGSIHLHVHRDGEMLLMSYDAFLDPILVSDKIPEDRVKVFCERTGTKYKKGTAV